MDEAALEKKLRAVNNTQECIETLSLWVLHHKHHSDQIASVWLRCLRKTSVKHRLALLYLCNDVLQRCRKQGRPQFLNAFKKVLQEAGTLLDQKEIRKQVDRVFSIWKQRKVYDEAFIQMIQDDDRKVMKSPSPPPALTPPRPQDFPDEEIIDFEPTGLVEQVKKVRKLQLDVGAKMGVLSSTKLDISRAEVLTSCKDKQHCEQFEKDFDEGIRCLKSYVTAIETSLQEHKELQTLLTDGEKYYAHQLTDVQLVANGFRTFAGRVEDVKESLGRFRIPSPPPLPDDCPSPTDSELDDMIISPERNESRTTSKETRISSDSFNPSSASFMSSDPQIFSQLKDVLRKDSRDTTDVSSAKSGRDEPCSTVSPKTSFPSTPLAPPPMPTGLLAHSPMLAFLGIRPFVSPRHQAPQEGSMALAHQDKIKEVDMEIEDDEDALPGLEKSLGAARSSAVDRLSSTRQDTDLRIRPNQAFSRPIPHAADKDERFPPQVPYSPGRADRSYLPGCANDRMNFPPASAELTSSCSPMSKLPSSSPANFNGVSSIPALNVEELLKKIAPAINRSNLTTIVQNKEEPESDIVDPDAYDPEDNFVMDVPRLVYLPPKASSNIVEVPTSDKPAAEKALQKNSKSELSSPDGPSSPSLPRAPQSLLPSKNQKTNDLSYLSDPRPSGSPPTQKVLIDYAHRRPLLPSPAAAEGASVQEKPNTSEVSRTTPQRTPNSDQIHKSPMAARDDRRMYERRLSMDQRNFRGPRADDTRRQSTEFRSPRGTPRGAGRGRDANQPRRGGGGHRHQADGKGWGASLEDEDRVFGYQHDKIDYLSLPRPVKKTPIKISKELKLEKAKADGSPLKQLAAALKDSTQGGVAAGNAPTQNGAETNLHEPADHTVLKQMDEISIRGRAVDGRQDTDGQDGASPVARGGAAGEVPEGGEEEEEVEEALEQNIVSVEIGELEGGGPADDPMLGQYFDTSSSFIVKDISEEEETPLPIIEIGETDTDLWTDATILDIDDGYGGNEDNKSIASLLEESSVKNVPRRATSSGLRGAVVATSIGSRRSSCRDQGAFDEFF